LLIPGSVWQPNSIAEQLSPESIRVRLLAALAQLELGCSTELYPLNKKAKNLSSLFCYCLCLKSLTTD